MPGISNNAAANAVQFPQHWKVPVETMLDIIILLEDHCPEWKEYYKRELEPMKDFIEARCTALTKRRETTKKLKEERL